MLLSKVSWFISYIYVYYLLHSNILDVVYGVRNPVQSAGVNRSCAAKIRISGLTRKLHNGKSLFYDEPSNSLLFTDSVESSVYRYFIDSGRYYNITLGSRDVDFVIPIEGLFDTYLVQYGDDFGILKWNCQSGKFSFRTLGRQDPIRPYPQNILNGGKVGRTQSRPLFFYSTPKLAGKNAILRAPRNHSAMYNFVNGKKKVVLSERKFFKGIGFSHDGKTIFYTDYGKNQTFRAFYNEKTNSIENEKLLQDFSVLGIRNAPNPLTIDAEGYIWLCTDSGRLLKVNPYNGNVECAIKVPAQTTSVVFGKCRNAKCNTLNCIYVVSASGEPITNWSGRLILIEGINSVGLPDYKVPLSTIYGH